MSDYYCSYSMTKKQRKDCVFRNYVSGIIFVLFVLLAVYSTRNFVLTEERYIASLQQQYNNGENDIKASKAMEELHSDLQKKQLWLYFSVIIMGATGLGLILLNADKIRRIKIIDKKRNEAMKLLENRVIAIEASREGISIIDSDYVLTYMNSALFDMYGIPQEAEDQFIGQEWMKIFPEEQQNIIFDEAIPEIEENGFWQGEFSFKIDGSNNSDDDEVYLDLAITRLPDGGFIGTTRDVTERYKNLREKKALEEQFYQAQKMEAVGRLAGGVAHDFNNILSAMVGYAEFLEEDLPEGSDQQKYAKNILAAGEEAKVLVDQMLAFSRRKDSASEMLDLIVCVQESLSIFGAGIPKTIEVISDYKVTQAFIEGNGSQIKQVLMNLCVNARDAMEGDDGEIRVEAFAAEIKDFPVALAVKDDLPDIKEQPFTWIEDISADKTRLVLGHVSKNHDYICLKISDSGCGMSRVIMEHIFEPFFTTKPVDKGTGLGMAMVHGVIVGHRGAMVIESTLGVGTSFYIYLPLAKGHALPSGSANSLKSEGEGKEFDASRYNILLVDDQKLVRDMTRGMLERLGYNVTTCESGLEALDLIRENQDKFDLVITDHNMPRMSGVELATQIHIDFPELPFILMTGYSQQQLQEMVDDFSSIRATLKKPVAKEIVDQTVRSVLSGAKEKIDA